MYKSLFVAAGLHNINQALDRELEKLDDNDTVVSVTQSSRVDAMGGNSVQITVIYKEGEK